MRYFVKRELTILGTLFVVYDGNHGTTVGEPKYFEADAQRIADRLNMEAA